MGKKCHNLGPSIQNYMIYMYLFQYKCQMHSWCHMNKKPRSLRHAFLLDMHTGNCLPSIHRCNFDCKMRLIHTNLEGSLIHRLFFGHIDCQNCPANIEDTDERMRKLSNSPNSWYSWSLKSSQRPKKCPPGRQYKRCYSSKMFWDHI